jgi:CRISPR-associated endonuclease/helicase Cas3
MKHDHFLAHPDDPLADHLSLVAEKAKRFAGAFGASGQGWVAGLLHDLGKVHPKFQERIHAASGADASTDAERLPHCHHGAALALKVNNYPVAFAINGHHAGLHNRGDLQNLGGRRSVGEYESEAKVFLDKLREQQLGFADELPDKLKQHFPAWLSPEKLTYDTLHTSEGWRAYDFFTRFLFSALVDADRLATEEADRSSDARANLARRMQWRDFDPAMLLDTLHRDLDRRAARAKINKNSSPEVDSVRQEVRAFCSGAKGDAVTAQRGLFSLTVPTGGGKSLASLLFALSHANRHNGQLAAAAQPFRRIIIVVPYLNITQQTAFEIRKVFGDLAWRKDAADPVTGKKTKHPDTGEEGAWIENDQPNHRRLVLEHHSNAPDPPQAGGKKKRGEDAEDDYSVARTHRQLAAENWDAPVVVTTSVQFFDSLFSRSPADCRKLHNIAQSLIIFDEIQTLPPHLLLPILDAIRELTLPLESRPYGCSAVFCTATQPALQESKDFAEGLKAVHQIVPNERARHHFEKLERVEYTWPASEEERLKLDDLRNGFLAATQREGQPRQGLIVFNTRRDCREFFGQLLSPHAEGRSYIFHLSTWMYPAHRLAVLEEVRRRLVAKEDCLLASTQCVETGVDIDFPVVWRQFGPYDAIVQAAGRCNREGSLGRKGGLLRLFHLVDKDGKERAPGGAYGSAIATTNLLCRLKQANPTNPDSFQDYFRLLYQVTVPDPGKCPIQEARAKLRFKEVSEQFNLIDSFTIPVLILEQSSGPTPARSIYDAAAKRLPCKRTSKKGQEEEAHRGYFTRDDWRAIQPYILNMDFRPEKNRAEITSLGRAFDAYDYDLRVWVDGLRYEGGLDGSGIVLNPETQAALIM